MGKLVFNVMTSLDGFYAGPNGELDWHYADAEHEAIAVEMLDASEILLFGRITYELMASYWPTAPSAPVADRMNALPKIVASRTLQQAAWNNTRLVKDNVEQEVALLKRQSRRDLTILGSANLAASLFAADLVDEMLIMACPIVLGVGKVFTHGVDAQRRFKLLSSSVRHSGVVDLRYQCTVA
jgi:dihydrofolate reductase